MHASQARYWFCQWLVKEIRPEIALDGVLSVQIAPKEETVRTNKKKFIQRCHGKQDVMLVNRSGQMRQGLCEVCIEGDSNKF